MARVYFYLDSAPKPQKQKDGSFLYLWRYYEERDKIDKEGHWRIESSTLSDIIMIIDSIQWTEVSFIYDTGGIRLGEAPWCEDGTWHFELDLGSYEEG